MRWEIQRKSSTNISGGILMNLMKAASSFRRSYTISWSYRPNWGRRMLYPGQGSADSTTSPPSFLRVHTGTWLGKSCQLHSAEQPTCTRGPLLQALQFFSCELMWASEEWLRGISFLYPLIGLYKICTRSVLERLGRQKCGKDERWMNDGRTQQEWYMDCMRTLG